MNTQSLEEESMLHPIAAQVHLGSGGTAMVFMYQKQFLTRNEYLALMKNPPAEDKPETEE